MIAQSLLRSPDPIRWRGDARAFRFLLLCLVGWSAVRATSMWAGGAPPLQAAPSPWGAPLLPVIAVPAAPEQPNGAAFTPTPAAVAARGFVPAAPTAGVSSGGKITRSRHGMRFALLAPFLQPGQHSAGAVPGRDAWMSLPPEPATAPPGQGKPFWMRRQMAGWSLSSWIYLREGAGSTPGAISEGGQLGGSQAGTRLSYGFDATGRTRAYARATVALRQLRQRELAFGVAHAPLAHLPVDIAVERRVAIGRDGRNAFAVMAVGGVSDVKLPAGFRLEAYAQAGVVGARARDAFADGAVVVDRELGRADGAAVRLGALAAGAVQPGAARVDVGPRLTLKLPEVGEGSRIALDWRQRIAGDARPASGLALTLAADF